jgi:hypothetical protein
MLFRAQFGLILLNRFEQFTSRTQKPPIEKHHCQNNRIVSVSGGAGQFKAIKMSLFGAVWREETHRDGLIHLK